MIKTSKRGSEYLAWVESEDTGKRLSRVYRSRDLEEARKRALERLRQIEYFKHRDAN